MTYEDNQGNSFTQTSNEAVVVVAEIHIADLKQDQQKDGAPGQIVYFPHQLINSGNADNTFKLTRAFVSGINFEQKDINIYIDTNKKRPS